MVVDDKRDVIRLVAPRRIYVGPFTMLLCIGGTAGHASLEQHRNGSCSPWTWAKLSSDASFLDRLDTLSSI